MIESSEKHEGFAYSRARWDWASSADHAYWITGTSSVDHFDRSGWADACNLATLCPGYRDQTILEWGSGSGRVTQYLCRMFRRTHAVDISSGMLGLLAQRGFPDLSLHHTDGAELPPGIAVDVVYSYICWMHNRKEDLPAIMRACRAVLKPTGKLVFQLPVYDEPRSPRTFIDTACWTPREFLELAEETGFAVTRMTASVGAFAPESMGANHFDLHEWRPRPCASSNHDANGRPASI
ncbi:class I SAM-dependent methyltransferase [Paludisphaera borealis]|uniref:Trans-aconitate 2-methyltransferase n=1 Tax=Paludisphaera borealis TaxID=1387353 RepID=A0A1U7CJ94_9BACT|nr:class I SAM-dependent methyltransferase [Paludisphaera borealis]APW58978.1 Trans-aconitate 2-methyltransferase [Paludisphaera borealis]